MLSNKKQYLNILQQNKQLKINYKIIQDDKILKEEQSSFLTKDDTIPNDAVFKINTLQKNIDKTYLATLTESPYQNIISTNNINHKNYDSIQIGNNRSIIIPKDEITSIERYYKDTGLDFILSPYTIMEEYLLDNGKKNSLNFLIYNNIIYTLVYNQNKEITFSKTILLTPFESTQDESFLEDDIVGQKLYEEVNFLEIQQFLNEVVEEYYQSADDLEFLEHIEMIYTLKPMSDEQIVSLQEELLIPISYRAISIDSYIDEIIQSINKEKYSFITPRIKKENKKTYLWISALIISILFVIALLNSTSNNNMDIENTKKQPEIVKENKEEKPQIMPSVEPSTIVLPHHQKLNTTKLEKIQMLLDVVPYDAILKDIEINENSSTFVSNFLINSDSLMDMQTKLKNIYVNSDLLLKKQNRVIINTIIKNETFQKEYNTNLAKMSIPYEKAAILSTTETESYLKDYLPKISNIKFIKKNIANYQSNEFSVISQVKSPEELINLIKKLNSQKLSVEIGYPIIFSKTTNFIELKYKLVSHQQNEK